MGTCEYQIAFERVHAILFLQMETRIVVVTLTEAEVYEGGLSGSFDYDVVVFEVVVGFSDIMKSLKTRKYLLSYF